MKKIVALLACVVVGLVGYIALDKSGIDLLSFGGKKDYEEGKVFYDNKEYENAFKSFVKACDSGEMRGCGNLGVMYEYGKGVEKDEQKAVQLFKKACDGGEMFGCGSLGAMYASGNGIEKDEQKAADLYKKVCKNNIELCAGILPNALITNKAQDFIEYGNKICDNKNEKVCRSMAFFYYTNKTHKDINKATQFFSKACDLKDAVSCGILGALYNEGKEVKKDAKKAFLYWQKACDLDDFNACAQVARAYINGTGVKQSYKNAFDYAQKACENEVAFGCLIVGGLYEGGDGVRQDKRLAKEYCGKACDLGLEEACKIYKKMR